MYICFLETRLLLIHKYINWLAFLVMVRKASYLQSTTLNGSIIFYGYYNYTIFIHIDKVYSSIWWFCPLKNRPAVATNSNSAGLFPVL